MPKDVSANLDFLRAVAVLLVLGQHLARRINPASVAPLTYIGTFGVLIFFVHTSLVLMYSMQRSGLRGRLLLKDFYIRRIFRIYPLSILAVTAALALHLDSGVNGIPGLSHGPFPGVKTVVCQYLLVQNLFHMGSIVNVLWSLPFELQMYVLLPFLFVWVERKRSWWQLLALWGASLFCAWAQPHVFFLSRVSLLRFVPCFLPGIIAFALPRTARLKALLWPVFIFGLVVAYALIPGLETGWFLCFLLGLGIPHFQEIQTSWVRFISNRIATYSYGIYISHQFCIWFAFDKLARQSAWLRFGILAVLLVVIPILLYYCIEKPMIRMGIRLAARGRKKSPVPLAPSNASSPQESVAEQAG